MASLTEDGAHIALKTFFPKKMSTASCRRAKNIQLILRHLAAAHVEVEDITDLLRCSSSGSRKYLRELLGVGLIRARTECVSRGNFVTRYCLNAEPVTIQKILEWQPEYHGLDIEILPADCKEFPLQRKPRRISSRMATRDPLVEALFGPPSHFRK